jgi:hypothetical protein
MPHDTTQRFCGPKRWGYGAVSTTTARMVAASRRTLHNRFNHETDQTAPRTAAQAVADRLAKAEALATQLSVAAGFRYRWEHDPSIGIRFPPRQMFGQARHDEIMHERICGGRLKDLDYLRWRWESPRSALGRSAVMSDAIDIKPLIPESSTSESTNVEVVMSDLHSQTLRIPDYQRDTDQWGEPTKSLFVESIINNLSVPAFFFEVKLEGGLEINEVVDGQQRLTTLNEFHKNKFRLVDSQDAPYLSPNSVHYAGKTFDELPPAYKQAFRRYRLTIIKLRTLGDTRLEVFRRINQGGTPLSGQDIRLAYYGEKSPSLALIRLAGVYDADRQAAKRFLESAKDQYGLAYPWKSELALEVWRDWWEDKEIARGQTPSETFLWSLVVSQVQKLNSILQNRDALQALGTRFNRAIDEALDVYCAQLRWQDRDNSMPPVLMTFEEMRDRFFPYFERWIELLLGRKGPSLAVSKHRIVASIIGGAYCAKLSPMDLSEQQWTNFVEFIRRPQDLSKKLGSDWPLSKGNWDGQKGYRAQMETAQAIVEKIRSEG